MTHAVRFEVRGPIRGKERPRFNSKTGRTYTPAGTILAEQRVRDAWRDAGAVAFGDQPVAVRVTVMPARPGTHYRVDGSLSAAGRRNPVPVKTPDLDNILKLVCDALNGHAFHDDKQVIAAQVERVWADRNRTEAVIVHLSRAVGSASLDREAA